MNLRFAICDLRLSRLASTRRGASAHPIRNAVTLTEILIILGIIVLRLALAVPAFNFIIGGRSVEGATNQISAFLSRARVDAIGLQEVRGVMFFLDPAT